MATSQAWALLLLSVIPDPLSELRRQSMRDRTEIIARRRCGAVGGPDGTVVWRVWAPRARQVELVLIDGSRRRICPMSPEPRGYFRHSQADVRDGQRYAFCLDGGAERPDPCSLWQPQGVHGP